MFLKVQELFLLDISTKTSGDPGGLRCAILMTLITLQNAYREKWCIYLVTQQSGSGLNTSLCLSQVGAFAFGFVNSFPVCVKPDLR